VSKHEENNPNEASARGHWSDPEFLANVSDLNPHLRHTQFADFHGHGWVFRAVFKKDRQGNLLDYLAADRDSHGGWLALPRDVDRWWRQRQGMRLVRSGGRWKITGEGAERAVLASVLSKRGAPGSARLTALRPAFGSGGAAFAGQGALAPVLAL